jgi:hypothetical protein
MGLFPGWVTTTPPPSLVAPAQMDAVKGVKVPGCGSTCVCAPCAFLHRRAQYCSIMPMYCTSQYSSTLYCSCHTGAPGSDLGDIDPDKLALAETYQGQAVTTLLEALSVAVGQESWGDAEMCAVELARYGCPVTWMHMGLCVYLRHVSVYSLCASHNLGNSYDGCSHL